MKERLYFVRRLARRVDSACANATADEISYRISGVLAQFTEEDLHTLTAGTFAARVPCTARFLTRYLSQVYDEMVSVIPDYIESYLGDAGLLFSFWIMREDLKDAERFRPLIVNWDVESLEPIPAAHIPALEGVLFWWYSPFRKHDILSSTCLAPITRLLIRYEQIQQPGKWAIAYMNGLLTSREAEENVAAMTLNDLETRLEIFGAFV